MAQYSPNIENSLPALGDETAGIIHDNLGIVLTYAFSKPALEEYRRWLTQIAFFVNCQSSVQRGPSSN